MAIGQQASKVKKQTRASNFSKMTSFVFYLISLLSIPSLFQIAATATTTNNTGNIASEIPFVVRVYKNGTVQRFFKNSFLPPSLHDPETGVSSKDVVISNNPRISARLYLPKSAATHKKLPILVYFHGGGFFFESAFSKTYHHYLNLFVSNVSVVVVSVEYRLAPEHYLPAAYEDCWEALKWVANNSKKRPNDEPWLKFGDFHRVFIAGDSAGGNIVHNMAVRRGFEKLPNGVKITGAIYAHPYFWSSKPLRSEGANQTFTAIFLWNFVYPKAPGGIDNPMMNPFAPGAPSLTKLGCSRVLVCVAEKDGLRDRGVWFYEGLKKSGWKGEAELFEQKGEGHVYHVSFPETKHAKKITKLMGSFIMKK